MVIEIRMGMRILGLMKSLMILRTFQIETINGVINRLIRKIRFSNRWWNQNIKSVLSNLKPIINHLKCWIIVETVLHLTGMKNYMNRKVKNCRKLNHGVIKSVRTNFNNNALSNLSLMMEIFMVWEVVICRLQRI